MPPFAAAPSLANYYVIIEGLPSDWRWQDLKDCVRCLVSQSCWIWTDVQQRPNHNGVRPGGVKIAELEDARNLFRYLSAYGVEGVQGHLLHVVMWDVKDQTASPKFIACNHIPRHSHGDVSDANMVRRLANAPMWQSVEENYPVVTQAHGTRSNATTFPPRQSISPYAVGQLQVQPPYLTTNAQYYTAVGDQNANMAARQRPVPAAPTINTRLPINTSDGVVQMENSSVHISNLHYSIRKQDVEDMFGRLGAIAKCKVPVDSTGKIKGNAYVTYESPEAATRAIRQLHEMEWKGRMMQVKEDLSERTPVGLPSGSSSSRSRRDRDPRSEPLVLNGSRGALR